MASKKPITFEDLMAVERVSSPVVHPDGKSIAYVTTKHDHKKNKIASTIRLLNVETGENRVLTPGKGSHKNPAWSPDGKTLAFVSDREHHEEKGEQIWLLPMYGGEARRLTSGDGGAGQPAWSPDGKHIAFSRKTVVSPHWDGKLRGKDAELEGEEKNRLLHAKA
ncbi:MAG: DPP IV N-terminal domain-containing protein, partial [Candidatus Thermoplasmatota archaeon]|nr:DPP IV N-terminal domain-containing protein [Candidatus Thermoplasmatota archaeon]